MKLQLEHVTFAYRSKVYSDQPVFTDVSIRIEPGECVALVGEEGSGKSTLLQLLGALRRPNAGSLMVDGTNIWETKRSLQHARRKIAFAFQFPEQQFFAETVEEEMLFSSKNFDLNQASAATRARTLLQDAGLSESTLSRSPYSLSLGESRRVALCSILLHEPEALLLDEPTAGLDRFGYEFVKRMIGRFREDRKTLVFASHDYELVSSVASRVVVLESGALIHSFSPREFSTFREFVQA